MEPSRFLLLAGLVAVLVISCEGNNFVSNALGSNMVLQRAPQKARLWGWTLNAGAEVTLSIDGKRQNATYTTTSDSSLEWSIELNPALAGGPHTIWVTSTDGQSQSLENVMFGDVWVCSGQSNMEFVVSQSYNGSKYISYASEYSDVRLFTVGQATTSYDPLSEFATIEQPWSVASADSVGGPDYSRFSAVCYYFGINLYEYYLVPIGLVSSNWGGTYIQAWSSPDALGKCTNEDYKEEVQPEQQEFAAEYFAEATAGNPNEPSVLWNAMIVPLLPMRVRGAIWYQGEANVGAAKAYACQFPAMIVDWREKWNEGPEEFGFHFVQLAPYNNGNNGKLPDMRLAQPDALNLPVVGFACTIDLGDPTSPYGEIHPRDKYDVGYRLFLNALYLTYHEEHITYLGPTVHQITYNSENSTAVVEFESSSIKTGLVVLEPVCPSTVPAGSCAGAELLTLDGKWHNATIALNGDTVVFSLDQPNAKVIGARYGYADWPLPIIFNGVGLPAPPFYFDFS